MASMEIPQTPQPPQSPHTPQRLPSIPSESNQTPSDKPRRLGVSEMRDRAVLRGASGRDSVVQTQTQSADVRLWLEHPKPIRSVSDLGAITGARTRTFTDLSELAPSTPRDNANFGSTPAGDVIAAAASPQTPPAGFVETGISTNTITTNASVSGLAGTGFSTHTITTNASTSGEAVEQKGSLHVVVNMPVRVCVVCMDEEITTAALACRHSALCDSCMREVRSSTGRCPICRAHIDYVIHGKFEGEFVDLAALALARVTRNVGQVGSSAYEELYENIRGLLAFSLMCAASGVTMLALMGTKVLAAVIASSLLFLIFCVCGYLPWFVITVQAFESEEGVGGGGTRQAFVSSEDFSRPGMLCVKVTFMILFGPALLILFVLPYFLLLGIVRPLIHYVLPLVATAILQLFFVIVCTSFLFIFRPVGAGIGHALQWLWTSIKPCLDVLSPVCGHLKALVVICCTCMTSIVQKFSELMRSCGAKLALCCASMGLCWATFLTRLEDLSNTIWNSATAVASAVYACGVAIYAGMENCATNFQDSFWRCGNFLWESLKKLVSPLAPCLAAILAFNALVCQAIDTACCEPLRRCCSSCATCLQAVVQVPLDCIGRVCAALFRNILAPIARVVSSALACLRQTAAALLSVAKACLHSVVSSISKIWRDVFQWTRQVLRDLRTSVRPTGG